MANKDSRVKISFVADEQQLNAALQRIESRLGSLEKSANSTATSLSFQSLQQGIQILDQLAQKINQVALQGASFNLLTSEFDKLATAAGESSNEMIAALDKAAKNSISNRDLMLAANRANLLGVTDDTDKLVQLMEISVARGDALGVSTTQAFNDIVVGLGRQSKLILDNLGIMVDIDKINQEYAKSIGKTVAALTDQEKKTALINAVIADSQRLLKDGVSVASENQSKIESLTASWTNLADTLSAQVTPALANVFGALSDGFDAVTDKLNNETKQGIENALKGLTDFDPNRLIGADNVKFELFGSGTETQIVDATKALSDLGVTSATVAEAQKLLQAELNRLNGTAEIASNAINSYGAASLKAANDAASLEAANERAKLQTDFMAESTRLASSDIYGMASASAYAASSLDGLSAKLQSVAMANSAFESSLGSITNQIIQGAKQAQNTIGNEAAKALGVEALEKLNKQALELKPNLESGNLSVLDLALTFGQVENDLLSPFKNIEEQNRLAQQQIKQTGKETNQLAQEAEQAFSKLQSQVGSVLSSALSGDIGINLDDILPRQDALNENARRLADIAVNGFDSPWYEYFKKEFPALFQEFFAGAAGNEGIKIQAANVIKNFQDGLQPELIDKESAKDMVRRALIGEQNMADLANEIAAELSAELGTSLQSTQNLARSVLGGGSDSVQMPTIELSQDSLSGLPDQFEQSFNDSFAGFSETFATNLFGLLSAKVVVESSATSGKLNGSSWGSGFMETVGESVPTALIDLLTLKVLPNVEGALKQSENRSVPR